MTTTRQDTGQTAPATSRTGAEAALSTRHTLPVLGGRTCTNPVEFNVEPTPTNPDPFVLRHRGRYYTFSSGRDGVGLSESTDLVTWRDLGPVLTQEGRHEYWAPCAARIDGRFYLYFSSREAYSEDPHDEHMYVAVADQVTGPYTVVRRLSGTFAIDPHVVRDPAGDWYMLYSTNEPTGLETTCVGTSILVDRLTSPTTLAGRPRPVVLPSLEEEIYQHDRFGDGTDWHTIEGATYFTHRDRAYLTYSGNAFVRPDYFIGYSTAPLTGSIGDLVWHKHPNDHEYDPLVRRSDRVEGTGHNSVTVAPNLVDTWLAYHGRDAAVPIVEGTEQRVMRIDPLLVSGGRLVTPAPSSVPQDVPAAATVTGLTTGWSTVRGRGTVDGGVLRTDAQDDLLVVHEHRTECYVAEVWVRGELSHLGARAGVVPWYAGPDDHVEALVDAATGTLQVHRTEGGLRTHLGSWPVDGGSLTTGHQLRVERTYEQVEVWVDGQAAGQFPVPAGPASVGLRAVRTATELDGFALTDHVDLYGERLRYLPRLLTAPQGAVLDAEGVVGGSRRPVTLTGPAAPVGTRVAYDLAVEASHGTVDLFPATAAGQRTGLRVRLTRHGYRLDLVDGEATTPVAGSDLPWARRATVRLLPTPDSLVVLVDDRVHEVPTAGLPAGDRVAIDLVAARLLAVARTSRTTVAPPGHGSPQPSSSVKEQR